MITEAQLQSLKSGDKAIYVGDSWGMWPEKGTVVTRKKTWLDDDHSVGFSWIKEDGSEDWHFIDAEELELIEE